MDFEALKAVIENTIDRRMLEFEVKIMKEIQDAHKTNIAHLDEKTATVMKMIRDDAIANQVTIEGILTNISSSSKKTDIGSQSIVSVKLVLSKSASINDFAIAVGKNTTIGECFYDSLVQVTNCNSEREFSDYSLFVDTRKEVQKPTKRGEKLKFLVDILFKQEKYAAHLEEFKKLYTYYIKNLNNGLTYFPTKYYLGCSDLINKQSLSDTETITQPLMPDGSSIPPLEHIYNPIVQPGAAPKLVDLFPDFLAHAQTADQIGLNKEQFEAFLKTAGLVK